MLINELNPGQIVKSKSGRDKGRLFFIIKLIDEEYVYVSDGDLRKVEKPKLKKIRHLAKYNITSDNIKNMILNNEKIDNAFLRCELESLKLMF